MKQRENAKKTLMIYGWLFVFIAFLDAANISLELLNNNFKELIPQDSEITDTIISVSIGVIAVVAIINFIINLIIGIRGIQQSKGKYNGKVHIGLAKFIFVIAIIGLIGSLLNFEFNYSFILSFIVDLSTIFITHDFIKNSKLLLKEK